MLVKPGLGQAEIHDEGSELRIVIPSKKHLFIILFLGAWMVGWLMGEIFALRQIVTGEFLNGPDVFLLFWLCGWTVGGVFAATTLLWNVVGKEIITVTYGTLRIERKIFDLGTNREYLISEMTNLRSVENPEANYYTRNNTSIWSLNGGSIAFNYGLKTVRMGLFIDRAEAEFLIDKIQNKCAPVKNWE